MTGRHRVADIAEQAGVSQATVDRVLHRRAGVSPRAVRQVEHAIDELDRQQSQLRLGAKTLLIDVVMQAPARFSSVVRDALENDLRAGGPVPIRARFRLAETGPVDEVVAAIDDAGRRSRRCDGLLLKAPDHPAVAAAIDRAADRGIPVVTLVTDVHGCRRIGYVGLDNAAAGQTAAYLIDGWAAGRPGPVLVTLSHSTFFGERERLDAFRQAMNRADTARQVLVLSDAYGLDLATTDALGALLDDGPAPAAVYSIGGGNRAIVAALDTHRIVPAAFVAHDLDADNRALLTTGRLTAVLHHDLRSDLLAALHQLMRARRLLPGVPTSVHTPPQIITPFNVPDRPGLLPDPGVAPSSGGR